MVPSLRHHSPTGVEVKGARLITVALLLAVNGDVAGHAMPVGSQGAQVFWGDVIQLLILIRLLVIILVILLACSATNAVSQLPASTHGHRWDCCVLSSADTKLCTVIACGSAGAVSPKPCSR